jgi:hypothetical protein
MPLSALTLMLLSAWNIHRWDMHRHAKPMPELWPQGGEVPLEAHLFVYGLQDIEVIDVTGEEVRTEVRPIMPGADPHYGAEVIVHATHDGQQLFLFLHDEQQQALYERKAEYVARRDWKEAPIPRPAIAPRSPSRRTFRIWRGYRFGALT